MTFRFLPIAFTSLLFLLACTEEPKTSSEVEGVRNFVINEIGDTIPTGVWLPIEGQQLNADSMMRPRSKTLKSETKAIALTPHIRTAEKPEVTVITKLPKVIVPGEAGVPLPETWAIQGRVVPAEFPEPTPARSPEMKDKAVADIRYLDMKHGMRYSIVRTLFQDDDGYLWMGTHGGVSRYDGNSFLHFGTKHGLPGPRTPVIFKDSDSNMWFGTVEGMAKYDGETWVQFPLQARNTQKAPSFEDETGRIWLVSRDGALHCLSLQPNGRDGMVTTYNKNGALFGTGVPSFLFDRRGGIWIGTYKGVYFYQASMGGEHGRFLHFSNEQGLTQSGAVPIFQDDNDAIWFTTVGETKLLHLNLEVLNEAYPSSTGSNKDIELGQVSNFSLTEDYTWQIFRGRNKGLWFLHRRDGLDHYSTGSEKNTRLTVEEGLTLNNLQAGLEDTHGNLWVGTFGGGLNRYNPNGFRHYSLAQGLRGDRIRAIIEDKQGKLWFGNEQEGSLHRYDLVAEKFTYFDIHTSSIHCLLEDRHGSIWASSFGKIAQLNPQTESYRDFAITNGFITAFVEDNSGGLWMASTGNGLYFLNDEKQKTFVHFPIENGMIDDNVGFVLKDRQGQLWIASWSGISRMVLPETAPGTGQSFNGKVMHYAEGEGLQNTFVHMLLEDRYGAIWAATQDGLHRYVPEANGPGRFEHFGEADGLSYHDIRSLQEDRNGNIWIGTYKGLSVLVRDTTSDNPENDFYFYAFTHDDGLKTLSFMQRSILLDSHNTLWMGTLQGLVSLDLNTFEFPTHAPQNVQLTHLIIDQQQIDYRRLQDTAYHRQFDFGEVLSRSFDSVAAYQNYPLNLRLPHDVNHLTFHFSAIDWYAPHKIQFQFRLEGFDPDWREPQTEPKIDYRNLPHGKYTLRVKAIGAGQVESAAFLYRFTILPPWWLTWWAYTLYALLALGAIYLFVRWRTTSLRRQRQLLRTRVHEQTREIRAEQKRSDELLLNILPPAVARELKETGKTTPVRFERTSILFADFKGFTNIVASIPGDVLVEELDEIFQQYDDIIEEVGLEKIQTIGDAYLAACGLPTLDPQHAQKCVIAAQKIIHYLEERNRTAAIKWRVRIGIHSGAITAGVIGKKKFAYDLFGDTINIAARIESASEPGRINISAFTYRLIKEDFPCTYRGKIDAKGKGELDMYFVD